MGRDFYMFSKLKKRTVSWALNILFVLVFIWVLFPIFWIIMTSLKTRVEAFSIPPLWVFMPTLEHYKILFTISAFLKSFANSAIIALLSTAIIVFFSALAGYAYSRFNFPLKKTSAFFLLAVRMFPPVVIVPSMFRLSKWLNIYDHHFLMVLLYASFTISFSVWMMKAFFDEVSIDLEEAAMVDGYTRMKAFRRVVLPLVAPGLVATSIFTFILSWNEFFFAFMFTSEKAKTAPVELVAIVLKETGVEWGIMSAGASLVMLPALIFSWFIQKHLVKGLAVGSIKG
jgi:ABC-type glycerol-3-phosphate transport system permease component